jgi:hypothetical protein
VQEFELEMLPILNPKELEGRQLPVVMVNACHSGRVIWQEDEIAGLPELFLSRVASAYIGTLGEVNSELAAELGARFFEAARRPGGINIAEFLSDIRREIAAGFEFMLADDVTLNSLINRFMYVYYGDPRLRLQLRPK